MKKNNVAVLLSSYNGEKFIEDQIESVLSQENVEVTLFVRDDGSTDKTTRTILKKFENKIVVFFEENIGLGPSFNELINYSGDRFDFYAFCDQDDIWLSDKLSRAISMIGETEEPTLYNSNQMLVDKNLNEIGLRRNEDLSGNYLEVLNNNKITGCTMVWNLPLQRELLKSSPTINKDLLKVRIHDVWVSMVASTIGTIIYDNEARILYRQHDNNVVGVRKNSLLKIWKNKLYNSSLRQGRSKLAREIIKFYQKDITDKVKSSKLLKCANYGNSFKIKLSLISDMDIFKYANENYISFVAKVLLNLF